MFTRRGFFGRMGAAVAGAALAVNMEFRSLVPMLDFNPPPRPWYYLIEETYRDKFSRQLVRHVRWIDEAEREALGFSHEDFADNWEGTLPAVGKTIVNTYHPRGPGEVQDWSMSSPGHVKLFSYDLLPKSEE